MTVIEIMYRHPFAADIAVGAVLTLCLLVLCMALLYSLERIKALSGEGAKVTSGNQIHQMLSESTSSPDSGSAS